MRAAPKVVCPNDEIKREIVRLLHEDYSLEVPEGYR
jgi:hypothetical protein